MSCAASRTQAHPLAGGARSSKRASSGKGAALPEPSEAEVQKLMHTTMPVPAEARKACARTISGFCTALLREVRAHAGSGTELTKAHVEAALRSLSAKGQRTMAGGARKGVGASRRASTSLPTSPPRPASRVSMYILSAVVMVAAAYGFNRFQPGTIQSIVATATDYINKGMTATASMLKAGKVKDAWATVTRLRTEYMANIASYPMAAFKFASGKWQQAWSKMPKVGSSLREMATNLLSMIRGAKPGAGPAPASIPFWANFHKQSPAPTVPVWARFQSPAM